MASTSSLRASATSLPHLLSSLPKNGQSALVRPVSWPETSFYKITRTKLKFRAPHGSNGSPAVGSSTAAGSSSAGGAGEEGMGELKAYGKAWGMRYYNGAYQKPSSPMAKPDEEIRKGLKLRWIKVDEGSLPSRAQEELRRASEVLRIGKEKRDGLIMEKRAAKRDRRRGTEEVSVQA